MRLRRGALALIAGVALVMSGCGLVPQPVAPAGPDIQDFEFDSFDAHYTLLRENDGGSRLRATETMTAVFPEYDQNRGIVRTLEAYPSPEEVRFEVIEVTDGAGVRRPFELEVRDWYVDVIIAVPEGEFVHGEQTYEITYQMNDVIRTLGADDQTFSWDVNGTGWPQPFGSVSVTVELVDGLAQRSYEPFCYVSGNDDDLGDCTIRGADGVYFGEVADLEPGRTLHVAVDFEPGTFG